MGYQIDVSEGALAATVWKVDWGHRAGRAVRRLLQGSGGDGEAKIMAGDGPGEAPPSPQKLSRLGTLKGFLALGSLSPAI